MNLEKNVQHKMIPLQQYVDLIKNRQIPPESPEGSTPNGSFDRHGSVPSWRSIPSRLKDLVDHYTARQECNNFGLWALVDKIWTKKLADWIGNRSVLEVMAGGGFISKALSEHGIRTTATDDYSWSDRQKTGYAYTVEKMNAVEAIRKFSDADILLISWPPYGDTEIIKACEEWGPKRPIIYIGEYGDGCCTTKEFFNHYCRIEEVGNFPFWSWWGLHDDVYVGYWKSKKRYSKKRKIDWK